MWKFLVLISWVSLGSSYPNSPRVIGGWPTIGEHYTVSVQNSGKHIYGGSIITPSEKQGSVKEKNFVLTAAQCVHGSNETDLKVLVGTKNLSDTTKPHQLVQVIKINAHPNFNSQNLLNDIAVLEVEAIKIDIETVKITDVNFPDITDMYQFSGWGGQKTSLRTLPMRVLRQTDCMRGSKQFCAKPYFSTSKGGVSLGDEGGPLLKVKDDGTDEATDEEVGIVSRGYGGDKGRSDLFTNVFAYKKFINDIIDG